MLQFRSASPYFFFLEKKTGQKKRGEFHFFAKKINFLRKEEGKGVRHTLVFFARINTAGGEGKHRKASQLCEKKSL